MQTQEMSKGSRQEVTTADILFSLVPLMCEYFEGSCLCEAAQIVFTLPEGRQMRLTAAIVEEGRARRVCGRAVVKSRHQTSLRLRSRDRFAGGAIQCAAPTLVGTALVSATRGEDYFVFCASFTSMLPHSTSA